MDLPTTVAAGDLRASLEAIRDELAGELPRAEGSQKASVAKELRAVLSQLDSLPVVEGSKLDDLAQRRAQRRGTKVPDSPTKGVKRGAGSGGASGKRRPAARSVAGK